MNIVMVLTIPQEAGTLQYGGLLYCNVARSRTSKDLATEHTKAKIEESPFLGNDL
jgi:hypothetical protein